MIRLISIRCINQSLSSVLPEVNIQRDCWKMLTYSANIDIEGGDKSEYVNNII